MHSQATASSDINELAVPNTTSATRTSTTWKCRGNLLSPRVRNALLDYEIERSENWPHLHLYNLYSAWLRTSACFAALCRKCPDFDDIHECVRLCLANACTTFSSGDPLTPCNLHSVSSSVSPRQAWLASKCAYNVQLLWCLPHEGVSRKNCWSTLQSHYSIVPPAETSRN